MRNSETIFMLPESRVMASVAEVSSSSSVFDSTQTETETLPNGKGKYVAWGADNNLPRKIIEMVGSDEVMSQNKFFNVLTCYGAGLRYAEVGSHDATTNSVIRRFLLSNSMPRFFLEQCTDMKYFFFAVSVIILSRDGKRIVQLHHKEACYCRFAEADKNGVIPCVYYADWDDASVSKQIETISLLNEHDPLGDLEVRMGRSPGADGKTQEPTEDRKFAILSKFPTPGNRYYPDPYYTAIFRGDWFDIKKLIGAGKKAKLKNHAPIKYQVEVHRDYWDKLCEQEGITDPQKKQERIIKEKENIQNFLSGIENSGKLWITGYYVDINGKEVNMVRINCIDVGREGGDWSEEVIESANITCYGDNIHPNLVGASPGKSQSNNSGSDKRELFTLKQSLEIAFHDVMSIPHWVIIYYNKWEHLVYPDVPIIKLTTLDENTDAKMVSTNTQAND